jgi:hypothetical protein
MLAQNVYGKYVPRRTIRDTFSEEQRSAWKPKIIARNTFSYSKDGEQIIKLHQTDIVTKHADGSVTINSGGWKTKTTRDRMAYHLPEGYVLYQDKGLWYVKQQSTGVMIPFFDGIHIPKCFTDRKIRRKGERAAVEQIKLRALIKKFVAKIDAMQELPEPSPGDCWSCALRGENGQTWGDSSSGNGHIEEHVREGYLHGSLLVNALLYSGLTMQNIGVWYAMDKADGKYKAKRDRRMIKRRLRDYLYAKLGLVA